MSASLVGSEMCIRDSPHVMLLAGFSSAKRTPRRRRSRATSSAIKHTRFCLLYTSDAADDM
eukprot:12814069-Alexandrium_andersonii.AAC.1